VIKLKARAYTEQQFLPWILFLDKDDTIRHLKDGKETYLYELYNHIATEFKTLDHYELYMFRITNQKVMSQYGVINLIIIKTPEVRNVNESSYLVICYNDVELSYYYMEYQFAENYSLYKIKNKQKSLVFTSSNPSYNDMISAIQKELL